MLEIMLLLIIILILGLMAIGYLIEVGGVFAWIGWGAVLVCCALFFYFSGMYPRLKLRKPERETYRPFVAGPPWSGPSGVYRAPEDGSSRFGRGKRASR